MGYNERKKDDKRKEHVVRLYLELILYYLFPDYKHNDDKTTQKLGVDCEFTGKNGKHYLCDEKAATNLKYINEGIDYNDGYGLRRRLRTFCIELSMRSILNGNWIRYEGWWLNDNELNNTLVLTWIDRTESGQILSPEDILDSETVIIKKEEIDGWLLNKGWTNEMLKETVNDIADNINDWWKKDNKWEFGNDYDTKTIGGLKFNIPKWLINSEAPINILIPRNEYRKMIPPEEWEKRIIQYKNKERVSLDEIINQIKNSIN